MSFYNQEQWFSELKAMIDKDSYLYWQEDAAIISVFDDVKYDRSDIDLLSPSMRRYITEKLKLLHCQLARGTHLISPHGLSLFMPKPSVLGASSFDITRYQKRDEGDIYILTPTQCAAYLLDNLSLEQAVAEIAKMLPSQPINLRKLEDHMRQSSQRNRMLEALPFLRYELRQAQEQAHMRHKRHIGSVF